MTSTQKRPRNVRRRGKSCSLLGPEAARSGAACALLVLAACSGKSIHLDREGAGGGGAAFKPDGEVLVSKQNRTLDILVDDTRLYWTTAAVRDGQTIHEAHVRSCSKDACADTTVEYDAGSLNPDLIDW